MQKPLNTNLKADLPTNWRKEDTVSPGGVEVGLSEQHGYNYLGQAVNEAHNAVNVLNEAFDDVQEDIRNAVAAPSIEDADTVSIVQANTAKKVSFITLVTTIRTKFSTVFAALSHKHLQSS